VTQVGRCGKWQGRRLGRRRRRGHQRERRRPARLDRCKKVEAKEQEKGWQRKVFGPWPSSFSLSSALYAPTRSEHLAFLASCYCVLLGRRFLCSAQERSDMGRSPSVCAEFFPIQLDFLFYGFVFWVFPFVFLSGFFRFLKIFSFAWLFFEKKFKLQKLFEFFS
jgi:hypothetical protein